MRSIDTTYAENNHIVQIRRTDVDNIGSREIEVLIDGGWWRQTFDMDHDRTPESYQSAVTVAAALYGIRGAGPRCTNSMVHDIWNAMRDIAGC